MCDCEHATTIDDLTQRVDDLERKLRHLTDKVTGIQETNNLWDGS